MSSYFPMTGFKATVCASTGDNRHNSAPTRWGTMCEQIRSNTRLSCPSDLFCTCNHNLWPFLVNNRALYNWRWITRQRRCTNHKHDTCWCETYWSATSFGACCTSCSFVRLRSSWAVNSACRGWPGVSTSAGWLQTLRRYCSACKTSNTKHYAYWMVRSYCIKQ